MLFPYINKHKVFKCSTEHLKYNSMYFFHINIYNVLNVLQVHSVQQRSQFSLSPARTIHP